MASRDLYPQEILQVVLDKSCAKAQSSVSTLAVLSVLAGGYIGFGYLAYLKVVSGIPHEWGGLATLLGAAMFPIALICILLGGGELVTSRDLCKIPFPPTAKTQTQVFGCFRFKYPLILPKYPLNPPRIPHT